MGLARDPRPAGAGAEDGDAADQLHGPAVDAGPQLHGVAVADGVQGLLDRPEGMPGAAVAARRRVVVDVEPRTPVLELRAHLHRAAGGDLHQAPVRPVPPRSGGDGVPPRGQPVPRQASVAGLVRQHQRAIAPQLEAGAGHGCARGEDPHVQSPQIGLRQDQAAQVLGQVLGTAPVPGNPGRGVPELVAVYGDHVEGQDPARDQLDHVLRRSPQDGQRPLVDAHLPGAPKDGPRPPPGPPPAPGPPRRSRRGGCRPPGSCPRAGPGCSRRAPRSGGRRGRPRPRPWTARCGGSRGRGRPAPRWPRRCAAPPGCIRPGRRG